MWHVYIVRCADQTFYTGITKDLERRISEHNNSKSGAKYTKGRRPVKLVYNRCFSDSSQAMREEIRIKRLAKKEKIKLVESH